MTLRTAARFGVAGSAIPFAKLVGWMMVASIIGQPIASMSFHWDPLALVPFYLGPIAVCGFLVVLYRVAAGFTPPPRLSDAALAASILVMVALAACLRWTAFPNVISNPGPFPAGWMSRILWMLNLVFEPVAWLWFLLTFVRRPAPPLARSTRRAAGWLALVLCLGGSIYAFDFVQTLVLFWWDFPPRRASVYYSWNGLVLGFLEALRWLLLLVFAVGVWRIRPPAEPQFDHKV